jgi:hypothetical protein
MFVAAGAYSSHQAPLVEFQIRQEDRNPWNHLRLNNDPSEFQFAIVSDRTGGHRAKIFSMAVEQLNLLQPEFVVSVGDLIEGYKEDRKKLADEWREFQGYIAKLEMPFFYVPGNHDLANLVEDKLWAEKFGRRFYHFIYRNVLFLMLCSEDPPTEKGAHFSADQLAYVKSALDEAKGVRWTLVFLHKPVWNMPEIDKTGWLEVEKLLTDRPYTVFAGHIHRYQKVTRNGRQYYQLATTGGASKTRGIGYGEFDHIVWATMKRDGPVLANVLLDGILTEDLRHPETAEVGSITHNRKPTQPVQGKVFFEGTPAPGAMVVFHLITDPAKKPAHTADGIVEPDGAFTLSTYTAGDGAPAGEYVVTVALPKPRFDEQGKPGPNQLPGAFAKTDTTPLKATVKSGTNDFTFELKRQ